MPEPVTLAALRQHFEQTYGFNPSQVATMLKSSTRSLDQVFKNISEVQKDDGSLELMAQAFHGLKGLLLNMGQEEWATYIQDIEQKLKQGIPCDIEGVVTELKAGLAEIYGD